MKRLLLLVLAIFIVSGSTAMALEADTILGVWATEKNDKGQAHVNITKENDRYSGEIIWLEKPTYPLDDEKGMGGQIKVDRENPDPKLRSRQTIGLNIVEGFHYAGDGEWKGGTIYDPANGKTYKCKMRLTDEGILKVRGFIGFSLIGRTTKWSRVIK